MKKKVFKRILLGVAIAFGIFLLASAIYLLYLLVMFVVKFLPGLVYAFFK